MQDIHLTAASEEGLSKDEIRGALGRALEGRALRRVLIIPPDFTRFHSNAGFITEALYGMLTARGVAVDVMPALGTHVPVTEAQWKAMFGSVPFDRMIVHKWRTDVVKLGDIPAEVVSEISEGLWKKPLAVELNRRLVDGSYDLIVSPGQVVPHEVIGMANHAKNLFVGVGGSEMINGSHMIGAVCGMEKAMGRDHSPVRRLFDWAMEKYVYGRIPVLFALTVTTAPGVERFGEDPAQQTLIRKYGYKGRLHTLEVFEKPESADLRENMGVAAHLIHGSSDGRFSITYAVKKIAKSEIEAVGFRAADYDEMAAKYNPATLRYGWNDVGGEEVYYIPNPALGLWIDRSRLA